MSSYACNLPVMRRPENQKKILNIFLHILLNPGFGQNHPDTRRGAIQQLQYSSHRPACVFPTEAPGRHRTQARTQASPAVS